MMTNSVKTNLSKKVNEVREGIIGLESSFMTPYGKKNLIYMDWAASGRLYAPIEKQLSGVFAPYVGNTHTETSFTGKMMTRAYKEALGIIKQHVNAGEEDVIITEGSGMTGVINKFQRIMGMKIHERFAGQVELAEEDIPVVFVSHMEHHSNQVSWEETIAEVVVLPPCEEGYVGCRELEKLLGEYKNRKLKIGAFTACSNVTGIETDYHTLSKVMHRHGGISVIDFSASAPYVDINMHPADPEEKLDVIVFSPHKFLGGPGTAGVLIFDSALYQNQIPDNPGGGTVTWTNPWGGKKYHESIQEREDGGTPAFMQTIRTALCIKVKESMGVEAIHEKEAALTAHFFKEMQGVQGVTILDGHVQTRLPIFSFFVEGIHHNLIVKMMNDLYGIQVRGGCSCAGTYGHFLLGISKKVSRSITDQVDQGMSQVKPGWVRVSLHPTTTTEEVTFFVEALKHILCNLDCLKEQYQYCEEKNEFLHKSEIEDVNVSDWFEL